MRAKRRPVGSSQRPTLRGDDTTWSAPPVHPGIIPLFPEAVERRNAAASTVVSRVEVVRLLTIVLEGEADPFFVIVADPQHEVGDNHGTGMSRSELVDVVDERLGEGFHFSSD